MGIEVIQEPAARNLTAEAKWELLSPYLLRHGRGCLAYATLQPGLCYWIVEGVGYVAFKHVGRIFRRTLVLGDPICHRDALRDVLNAFARAHKNVLFLQATRSVAKHLTAAGWYANQCGVETEIDPRNWELKGTAKQNLRTAANLASRLGIRIEELPSSHVDKVQIRQTVDEWLQRKAASGAELSFLTRPMPLHDEPHARRFYAHAGTRLLAFIVYNPLFEDGRPIGYCADMMRHRAEIPHNLIYAIQVAALEVFSQEGLRRFSLGWSPLYRIEDLGDWNDPLTTVFLVSLFHFANRLYNFKGVAMSKREFRGEETPVYLAMRERLPIGGLLQVFSACGISPIHQIARSMRQRLVGCFQHKWPLSDSCVSGGGGGTSRSKQPAHPPHSRTRRDRLVSSATHSTTRHKSAHPIASMHNRSAKCSPAPRSRYAANRPRSLRSGPCFRERRVMRDGN